MSTTLPLPPPGLLGVVVLAGAAPWRAGNTPSGPNYRSQAARDRPPLPPGCECKLAAPGRAAASGRAG